MDVSRFDVVLVNLDPTVGSEIRKSRPCVVVSPDEMNRYVRTVVVAPLTAADRPYPSRVPVRFAGKDGRVVSDSIDASRRPRPGWPGWAPALRPEAAWRGRGGTEGGSAEGGNEELREFRLRRSSRSATRISSRRFASLSSAT